MFREIRALRRVYRLYSSDSALDTVLALVVLCAVGAKLLSRASNRGTARGQG